jgi:glutathione S-transferase
MSTASTVLWSLAELGIPYEGVRVNLRDEADKKQKLGPVNPNLRVPVLVHDGTAIFESAAIQIYLGETFGTDKGLFPAAGPKRGAAMKWLVWGNATLAEAVIRWQRNVKDWAPANERNAVAGEKAKGEVGELIGMLEKELTAKQYLVGDVFSLTDLHLVSILEWIGHCGLDLAQFPKTSAWMARCAARPSHAKAEAIEGAAH